VPKLNDRALIFYDALNVDTREKLFGKLPIYKMNEEFEVHFWIKLTKCALE
jgi:hypothetical protein